jgi:hypothetical protein
MFLLSHATPAQWDTFLQAVAKFLWDAQFPRAVSWAFHSVLKLDAGPYATSSLLQKISLRFLPWGAPDALLRIPLFLFLWLNSSCME